MGKIRVKTLGLEGIEEKEKEKALKRKETKQAKKTAKTPGLKGGERVVDMGVSLEELEVIPTPVVPEEEIVEEEKKVARPPKKRGKQYQVAKKLVDPGRLYPLGETISLLKKTSVAKFDGTVEAHFNVLEKGLSGMVVLPHGTGKKLRVAIASEKILGEIESGKINFDILVSPPEMMPKLAKVAKILGPRGLMPNPKAGTISEDPQKLVKTWESGRLNFKTETQAPLIHTVIGKVSFPEKHLEENLKALVSAIGKHKIEKMTLTSTMGPGIKVDLETFTP